MRPILPLAAAYCGERVRGSEGNAQHSTVNALIVCSIQMIMRNVAALTFYATIYEDICHVCNKSRNKGMYLVLQSTRVCFCYTSQQSVFFT